MNKLKLVEKKNSAKKVLGFNDLQVGEAVYDGISLYSKFYSTSDNGGYRWVAFDASPRVVSKDTWQFEGKKVRITEIHFEEV